MTRPLLSADVGEGSPDDVELLRLLDSANVCCGVHAGTASMTIATALRCRELGVEVVAHPGYDDRPAFGRRETGLPPDKIERLVAFQVAALASVVPVHFVKPHGALYHRCQADRDAASALLRAVAPFAAGVIGQPGFEIVETARRAGVTFRREAFADRAYAQDGTLRPREQAGSVLPPRAAAQQAARFVGEGDIDTICVHSDSDGVLDVASAIRQQLDRVS